MLNHQEALELERATARAAREGTTIIGRGRRKADGVRVFAVASSRDATRAYLVAVETGRLVCECPSRKVCKHRAIVHAALVAEATARRVAREAAEAATRRESAPLRSNTRPFSLYR